MQSKTSRLAKPGLLAVLVAAFALVICAAMPAKAMAYEYYAHSFDSSGNRTNYLSILAATIGGYSGDTIIMDRDWDLNGTLEIADSKSVTIDMNGHKIYATTDDMVFLVNEHASLTLTSSKKTVFTYKAPNDSDDDTHKATIETGGLITGGNSTGAGGIRVNNDAKLTLDNVAVAGNMGDDVGGIYVKKNCTVNMKNGASVNNNKGGGTGGILIYQANSTLNMDASSIYQNYGVNKGGGILSKDDYTKITMENGSSIYENKCGLGGGGGIVFAYTYFTLMSQDKTAVIRDNVADGKGGGIYVESKTASQNEGTIDGITISGNSTTGSNYDGGGIYLDQRYTRVTNCNILNNSSGDSGGGVYVNGNNCSLTNCTITGNKAGTQNANACGGGVFVFHEYDVYLSGVCIIRQNTDSAGNDDDVCLESMSGWPIYEKAYIKGGVDNGSSVGIYYPRTPGTKVGIDITNYTYGTYFCDQQGVCITPGDKTLWVSSGSEGYLAKVNGQGSKRYQKGASVTANGKSSDSSKHFWFWDTNASTGLSPISDFITDKNRYDEVLTYTMPNNDTDLKAAYVDYVKSAMLSYDKLEVGRELPKTGTFTCADGTGITANMNVALTWYLVDDNNNRTAVTGVAEAGKKYTAVATVAASKEAGIFFKSSILTADNVTIRTDSTGAGDQKAYFTRSSVKDFSIDIETPTYTMPKPTIESVEDVTINVRSGYTKAEVEEVLPLFATTKLSDGTEYLMNTEIKTASPSVFKWPAGLLDASDKVITPAGGSQEFTTTVQLVDSEHKVESVEGKAINLTIKVTGYDTPDMPKLDNMPATYTGSSLTVKATCTTEGADIYYSVDGGEAVKYDSSKGIALAGEANKSTQVKLKVWSHITGETAGGGASSEAIEGIYALDDTADKEITVKCSDTALYADGDTHWERTFTVTGTIGDTVAVVAPTQDGRVFDHWEWTGAPEGTDLKSPTLAIANYSVDYTNQITAVYTPIISTIDLEADVPIAHNALAKTAKSVKVGVGSDGATTDISSYLASAEFAWTPENLGEDGNATHNETYTATLSLKAGSAADGVKYLLADDVKVLINGNDVSEAAYIIGNPDGTKSIEVDFPETEPYKCTKLDGVDDSGKLSETVEITYADALEYQAEQDQDGNASWSLPEWLDTTFECKEAGSIDVEWGNVTGFAKDATGEQTLTATGKVSYTSDIDNTGAPTTVTATIKVAAPEKVEAPTVNSPAPGDYDKAQTVTLKCATEDADIYFTTDGTEPTESSEWYDSDGIYVDEDTTIKAIAVKDGMLASDVATFNYKISYKTCEAPTASPVSDVYESTQQVTLKCATEGADIYYATYTVETADEDLEFSKYDGEPIEVTETTVVVAYASAKDMNDSETAEFVYVIARPQTAKPHANVEPGTYATAQTVTITSATETAVIHYTTDGTDPTEDSPVYEAPITVDKSMTIKAIAVDMDGELLDSDVATFEYVIQPTPDPTPSGDGDDGSTDGSGSSSANGNAAGAAGSIAATGDAAPFALVGFAALVACAAFALAALKLRRNR